MVLYTYNAMTHQRAVMSETNQALAPRPSRQAAPDAVRPRLTPETWVVGATEMLVDKGIDSVRVDVLAKELRITRGSFYWHFKDREELLQSVLKAWQDAATEQLIERFESRHSDAQQLIRELISLPFRGKAASRAARIELAIRAWARRDAMARQAVDEVDSRRMSYIAQCFSALGFPIKEARTRAALLYAYSVGESLLWSQGTTVQKTERSSLMEQLLLTRLPDKS